MIWDPFLADDIVRSGAADMVALARELPADPDWAHHAHTAVEPAAQPDDAWPAEFGWWLDERNPAFEKLGLRPQRT